MNYAADVPVRFIDLRLPPERRWAETIAADLAFSRQLLQTGWDDALREAERQAGRPRWLLEAAAAFARGPFHAAYRASRGRYLPEIYAWADALGESRAHVVMMQCMYELSHLDPVRPGRPGCSAGVRHVGGLGMVHVRTLDWAFDTIGPATRLFEFRNGARTHFTVGMPGLVGALSGMVPGGFSVTINWAPPVSFPFFYLGPLLELRNVFETCDTYAQAVERLRTARLATSVFFTVCGVNPGEACVLEHVKTRWLGGHEVRVREIGGGVLAQSNHYQHPDFVRFNPNLDASRSVLMKTSPARAAQLAAALERTPAAGSLEELHACLGGEPVENPETRQKMVFCPARGELRVWREVQRAAAASPGAP